MSDPINRELRLAGLMVAILASFGIAVVAVADAHGQLELLRGFSVGETVSAIWTLSFSFVLGAYALDMLIRRRPSHPLRLMAQEFREHVLRPDLLLARGGIVLGSCAMLSLFTPAKVMIANVRGFPLDEPLANLDRVLFLGHDPWQITHALFGGAYPTFLIQLAYNLWFVVMWLSIIYAVLRPGFVALRARYILAFLLCWIVVGSVAATAFASAGPCFYERAFGDARFAPLMIRLATIDAELRAVLPSAGVWALSLQDMLWSSFVAKRELFGGGISAMPSMHVAQAVLMALAARELGRGVHRAAWAYAVLIWIGSVHLGWHYATDGLVGGAMAYAIWRLAGWLVERYVLAPPPGAAAVPA